MRQISGCCGLRRLQGGETSLLRHNCVVK